MGWTAEEIHQELADYYAKYRGAKAPETTYSLSLWHMLELLEDAE